jgi:hypothetical protein
MYGTKKIKTKFETKTKTETENNVSILTENLILTKIEILPTLFKSSFP